MALHNSSPNIEERFSKIDIHKNDARKGNSLRLKDPLTIPVNPNLSTSKRAEQRNLSRSSSSNNLANLYVSKTPSRNPTAPKALLTAKANRKALSSHLQQESRSVGGTPYKVAEFSYMRDTSSSIRKINNPFNTNINTSPTKKSFQRPLNPQPNLPQSRKILSTRPTDITNLNYEKSRKPELPKLSPRRHVSQPFESTKSIETKSDVHTRLYNDSKVRVPSLPHFNHPTSHNPPQVDNPRPIRRSSGNFDFDKTITKVETLEELYQIIYEEDPNLFEDTNHKEYEYQDPRPPQDLQQSDLTNQNPLDIYERGEILRRKDVYFVPPTSDQIDRKINIRNYSNNYGFDDANGNYIVVPKDHINYRYEILSVLGNGSFGNVVKCKDKKYLSKSINSNIIVAIKIIKNDLNWSLQAVYEIKMLKHLNGNRTAINSNDPYTNEYGSLDCPVLTYYDHFHFRGHMCIVTEPLSINLYSLLEIIKFQGLSLPLIKIFTTKILQGLKYIHDKNVIHCDIKPENIMMKVPPHFNLDNLNEESVVIKIVDFGSSCFTNEISYLYIQSRFYRAPEVIIGAKYDKMIDIWSIGCLIAELFTGDPLLPGKNELEQIAYILELFGSPSSSLITQQRHQLLRSIKERKSTKKFDEKLAENPNILQVGLADEKTIKKTLLYTLFDMEGKINMQFLNMRVNAASTTNPNFNQPRKVFKVSSKNLEVRLRLRLCDEDRRDSALFMKFLTKIFKWNPIERADASQLLNDPFLSV